MRIRFPGRFRTVKCDGTCGNDSPHDAHLTKLYKLWLRFGYWGWK